MPLAAAVAPISGFSPVVMLRSIQVSTCVGQSGSLDMPSPAAADLTGSQVAEYPPVQLIPAHGHLAFRRFPGFGSGQSVILASGAPLPAGGGCEHGLPEI